MKYFAGLDVSLEETAICVVDEGGEIIKEMRSESEPEALVSALLNMRLDFDRIGLEACSLTVPSPFAHDNARSSPAGLEGKGCVGPLGASGLSRSIGK